MLTGLMVAAAWLLTGAAEPEVKWVYEAQSQLYAAPLVGDLNPAAGLEVVIGDSDTRRLRCIGADGKQLWEYDGGWKKRLTSGAALSRTARPGKATLAVGNGDGSVDCVDGELGTGLWKAQVGKVEWSNVVWADLNGDGRDELVVASEETGLTALDADGKVLWKYAGSVSTPIAVADVDGDQKCEVFACMKWGPLCVNGDGTLRWRSITGQDFFESSIVVTSATSPGVWEAICASVDAPALESFDAATGKHLVSRPMAAAINDTSSAGLAVGDLTGEGVAQIVVADKAGNVHCFNVQGSDRDQQEPYWVFATLKATGAAVTLGDVDGDHDIEVLVASGDHHLYCLGPDGVLEWRYATDLRLLTPPTLADVDNDGQVEMLLAGSDHKLRCLTLGGAYSPELLPWPARRFDAAQHGASTPRKPGDDVVETRPLFADGGFERVQDGVSEQDLAAYPELAQRKLHPLGWQLLAGTPDLWRVTEKDAREGVRCLAMGHTSLGDNAPDATHTGKPGPRVSTPNIAIPHGLRRVNVRAWSKGNVAACSLDWIGLHGRVSQSALAFGKADERGWVPHQADALVPPPDARWLRLVLSRDDELGAETLWDDVRIDGDVAGPREITALVSQAGYDIGMPKRFVVQSNFEAPNAAFELVAEDGSVAFRGALEAKGRIVGAFENDWGHFYWGGSFSPFDAPGNYRIRIAVGTTSSISWPFEVGEDVLWKKTARPAYRFFYYQRCGMEIPGLHKACHLDDSTDPAHTQQWDLTGGWHDAGDYNKYHNAPYVLGLAWSYEREKALFDADDEDGNGRGDFLDEILWGADHAVKMIAPDGSAYGGITSGYGFWGPPEIETDNKPLTGDERPTPGPGSDPAVHAAAVAKAAKFTKDAKYIEAAKRALQYGLDRNQRGPLQFSASIDLYLATGDEKYAQLAREMAPSMSGGEVDALELYDRTFGEDHSAKIREALKSEAEALLANARNPFGVWTFGPPEKPNFFGTPAQGDGWHVGNSQRMFEAANRVALAYRYVPDPRYLEYVYDQFNWTLGVNPYNISLLEGVGSAFPPSYHQRLTFAGVARGAVPGSVVNGITSRAPGDDRPYFDMRGIDIPSFESNEVWLPHNTAYLSALTGLEEVHRGGDTR